MGFTDHKATYQDMPAIARLLRGDGLSQGERAEPGFNPWQLSDRILHPFPEETDLFTTVHEYELAGVTPQKSLSTPPSPVT
jgi:hypothetical protein